MSTRDRLVDAAIRCLAEDGWARTTTRRILAVAGAHAPDVNYYFGSKDGLMHEAAVRVTRRWAQGPLRQADATAGATADADTGARLTAVLQRFLDNLHADRTDAVAAIEVFAQAERSEALRSELRDAYEDFRAAVGDIARPQTAEWNSSEIRALATVLIALFDGLAVQSVFDPDGVPGASDLVHALAILAGVLHDADGAGQQ
ncbi:MAG: TetR/AcrR family transcriptional regulator [Mycolicibacterium neoaurum]|uniref:TetR/AcrR family transcriptional regulator n=1 Tax=Mycolicibacterium neoaurum TaxID=1795 RepID=UPI002FF9A7C2